VFFSQKKKKLANGTPPGSDLPKQTKIDVVLYCTALHTYPTYYMLINNYYITHRTGVSQESSTRMSSQAVQGK